ncbi:ATP-binding protein [Chitinivorax sp. B]|uniref:ATP-binding protein n=1 Tax=Chitinivorax sp. B TaxID=2502235 RepID=UPI0010F8AF2A|nr:ATP-binding protein [Chitinivorax sp. B]
MHDGLASWSVNTIKPTVLGPVSPPIWYEAAQLAGRLAEVLQQGPLQDEQSQQAIAFLTAHWQRAKASQPTPARQPLDTLCHRLKLGTQERMLLVLAGMADEHEGFVATFAGLHPRNEPFPTVGLLARLAFDSVDRSECWRLLTQSPLIKLGLVRLSGDGAWPEHSLHLAERVWPVLYGLDCWPQDMAPQVAATRVADSWLQHPDVRYALSRLGSQQALAVSLQGEPQAMRVRLAQLLGELGQRAACFDISSMSESLLETLLLHCLLRDRIPVLIGTPTGNSPLARFPAPLLLAETEPVLLASLPLPVLPLPAPRPSRQLLAALWQEAMPELGEQAIALAARFPLEPRRLFRVQDDARAIAGLTPLRDTTAYQALKTRLARGSDTQVRRLVPHADWPDLVLPPAAMNALHDAVARLALQAQVMDDWGFERGDANRRGLRLLFCGLPGTGKTLAAEVIAHALHAELMVIDLSRIVSKWIGETEKNLAAVFEEAETTRGVLFFDEADALFAKRTDVHDANDRFANIETAYLLTRLERFDGIAILATNLRQHIDKAFLRRFEFVIDFPEPGAEERAAIWQRHVPAQAPIAAEVDFEVLALRYPMSGAMIRNALLSAAYYAAARQDDITCDALERAIALEFEKTGRLCP